MPLTSGRTGDLGRYLESGDVECTGRADDQVCINRDTLVAGTQDF